MKFLKTLSLFALLAILALTSCQKDEIHTTDIDPGPIEPTENHINGLLTRSNTSADGLDLGCVSIDYPFQLVLIDGTTADINDESDFLTALEDEDNYPVDFVYPLNVTDEAGNELTVNDADELGDLFADCIPDTGWDDEFPEDFFPAWVISYENSCLQLTYPLTLVDIEGEEKTANDENELISLLSDGNIYSFTFPLNLEDEDGNPVTADDANELFELLAECGPGPGNGGCGIGTFACYQIGYPATLLLIDGSTVVVNDDDEFASIMMTGEWAGFEFPLTLIDAGGNEIVVNNEEELQEAMLDCDPNWGGGGPGIEVIFGCYELGYPVTLQLIDGSTTVANNEDELNDVILSGEWAGFGYPMTLIDQEGNIVTVNNDEELNEALMECDDFGGGPFPGAGDFFCYDFSYPISIMELSTGNQQTFNNSNEWIAYHNNPNTEPYDFVFPVTLIDEDGDELAVNDQDDLFDAIEECW